MDFTHCKQRKIKGIEEETPILVPSFSSKGFPEVGDLYNNLKEYLTDVSLVSAYDLHYKNINIDSIYETDMLLIDSGGYERDKEHDLSTIYRDRHISETWNRELHHSLLEKIESLTNILIVNFDSTETMPLSRQLELANETFAQYPDFASDFLCKPSSSYPLINIDEYCQNIDLISNFSVVGFTEKELGFSLLERCKNIYRVRKSLENKNLEIPIHIFGCIDPLNIIVYFLSGADIFDGLSWLRFAFNNDYPTYFNSYSISNELWSFEDDEVKALAILENLRILCDLKERLIEFTSSNNWDSLNLDENTLLQIRKLSNMIKKGE
ncbi:hypothetical protein [Alkalihalobacillus sp. TS-13]|uniref:hypothetical protein n=1 Tax=Alkalihalobacillus sp. TS-13 TaxID=2842455 RepID=UPI001C86B459|nr:hypothetical protein [Alkalihalobacillus sp. TS-13]